MPRVFVVGAGDLGDQRARVAERDACADAVLSGSTAEDVRQPLAQPPLDALGRDDDELLGERVGQRIGEKRTEAIGQEIGSLRAVEMQGHRASDYGRVSSMRPSSCGLMPSVSFSRTKPSSDLTPKPRTPDRGWSASSLGFHRAWRRLPTRSTSTVAGSGGNSAFAEPG